MAIFLRILSDIYAYVVVQRRHKIPHQNGRVYRRIIRIYIVPPYVDSESIQRARARGDREYALKVAMTVRRKCGTRMRRLFRNGAKIARQKYNSASTDCGSEEEL